MNWSILRSLKITLLVATTIAALCCFGYAQSAKKPKIGLVLKPLDNTYFGAMARGAEAAAKEFGVGLTTVAATALTDDAGQASQLAALDASGEYSCYIVNPVSPTNLLQPLSSVSKKGQPIINIDLPIDLNAAAKANVTITSYMGSDSVATGAVAGKYMLAILPNGSTVALIGGLPADPCYQGVEACIAALAGKSVPKNVSSW